MSLELPKWVMEDLFEKICWDEGWDGGDETVFLGLDTVDSLEEVLTYVYGCEGWLWG